jgi:hypothetical protein
VGVALSGKTAGLLYSAGKGFALLFLFLFKYLDLLWFRAERSTNIASVLCAHVEK